MPEYRKPNMRRYQEMSGRGGMGEHVGDPRRNVTEPGTSEDTDLLKGIFKGKQESSESRTPRLDPVEQIREYGMRTVRTIPVGARMVNIENRLIDTVPSGRIDTGLEFRKDILLVNMSLQTIWVNTRPMPSSGDGLPLGPMSAAGKYDGAAFSIDATMEVEWHAIAGGGASNLLIVVESSR